MINKTIILDRLSDIENQHGVRILFAAESGSRAWGFASQDSDFDVRFIYIHPQDEYLSILNRRDVIECGVSETLDVSGWDIRKALILFSKSNPPLLEWLGSPMVYMDKYGFADRLRSLVRQTLSTKRCMYHYLHMAMGNYREYLKGDVVRLKKYLYVLRPILACLWIEKHGSMPPTEFQLLVNDAQLSCPLQDTINDLLARKMSGEELAFAPRVPELNNFIDEMLHHFHRQGGVAPPAFQGYDVLDDLFRDMLRTVWDKS